MVTTHINAQLRTVLHMGLLYYGGVFKPARVLVALNFIMKEDLTNFNFDLRNQ